MILGPGVGVHGDPLRRDVVEEEEASADRGEDRQEADELLLHGSASDTIEPAFDDGAAAVVGEVAQTAQRGLDATPHQPLVDGPLVIRAGEDGHGANRTGIRVEPERQQEASLHDEVEHERKGIGGQDQPKVADVGPARLDLAHHPASDDRDEQDAGRVARSVDQERFGDLSTRLLG